MPSLEALRFGKSWLEGGESGTEVLSQCLLTWRDRFLSAC